MNKIKLMSKNKDAMEHEELVDTSFQIPKSTHKRMSDICSDRKVLKKEFVNDAIVDRCNMYDNTPVAVQEHTANKIKELCQLTEELRKEMEDKDLEMGQIKAQNKQLSEELMKKR